MTHASEPVPQGPAPGPLLIGLAGTELTAAERDDLRHPWVGGVVLFSRNFHSRAQISDLCAAIRAARNAPLLIAVDHEGGRVQRFRQEFTRLPPLAVYGRQYADDARRACDNAYRHARVTAGELLACGIDLAFAPVMDLDRGSEVIGNRAFGAGPDLVADLSRAFIAGLRDGGMAAVGKHFPGHGSVAADSHHQVVTDHRSWQELSVDLQPFRALAAELDAVMMAHVRYPCMDDAAAGFSPYWIHTVLRQEMAYRGVVISDDLGMAGAAVAGDLRQRLLAALQAGCDLALICSAPETASLLHAIAADPVSAPASAAVTRLAGRQRPDLQEFEQVSEWRQWRRHLEELATS